MNKRKITKLDHLKFEAFDKYGKTIKGWSWHKISFDKKTNFGTYISKLDPGTKTLPHIHTGHEEFLVLEGEIIDSDGTIFKKNDFVRVIGSDSVGTIDRIDKNKVVVSYGFFTTKTTLDKLELVDKS